jgi:chlorite dismutase
VSGQYVSYSFYKVDPTWRRLPVEERTAAKDAFAEVVEDWTGRMEALHAYALTGVRPDADFFLWKITQRYEDLGELGAALNATPLAGWLETPYSYLATTKASQYTSARRWTSTSASAASTRRSTTTRRTRSGSTTRSS